MLRLRIWKTRETNKFKSPQLYSNISEFSPNVISLHVSRYLYGFEEYCRSANIEFQMALPEKVANKPCKECDSVKEIKVKEESEPEMKEIKIEEEEKIIIKEENPTEDDVERKENIKPSLVNQILSFSAFGTLSVYSKDLLIYCIILYLD